MEKLNNTVSFKIFKAIDSKGNTLNPSEHESELESDICFLLEGTYPYVAGGVSSWVHDLIKGLPELTFNLVLILPEEKEYEIRYDIPPNVKGLYLIYLNKNTDRKKQLFNRIFSKSTLKKVLYLHKKMFRLKSTKVNWDEEIMTHFYKVAKSTDQKYWNISSILHSRRIWKIVKHFYSISHGDSSFVEYFRTWQFLHIGILTLFKAYIPPAKVYHTISTGYAGLLAARASLLNDKPMLLTEHGIYSKERKIEISRSPWIFDKNKHLFRAQADQETFRNIWINAFRIMSKICYDTASEIITLYGGNQRFQIEDGAAKEKMRIIPNGVSLSELETPVKDPQPKKVIGFVGRIVPIKDVKTFIRAIALVFKALPDTEAWLMGPTEEDKEYYRECIELVNHLGIKSKVKFTGRVNLKSYYPKLDILVLTSISEAQPLVILEAFAYKVPVVSSDVGGCRELVTGMRGEDAALGKAGIITGLANPAETAGAIVQILRSSQMSEEMGTVGQKRAKKFYDMPLLYESYRKIYQNYIR